MMKEESVEFEFGNSSTLKYRLESEVFDGVKGDTAVILDGANFFISGSNAESFKDEFEQLVKKYHI